MSRSQQKNKNKNNFRKRGLLLPSIAPQSGRSDNNTPQWQLDTGIELVESGKRLSECVLWSLIEEFYHTAGITAWEDIPFYPTCNTFIARTYAEMILAFLMDYQAHLHVDEPVYILEMAAGSGALGYYITRELKRRQAYYECLKPIRLVYILTDFTENNVRAWEANPKLQPLAEAGLLDFAVFRPDTDTALTLRHAQTTLSQQTLVNPIISTANYFFDSIAHDLFQVDQGVLKEGQVSFVRDIQCEQNIAKIETLCKVERFVPVTSDYYSHPVLNQVLRDYQDTLTEASILFPVGAFRCLDNLLTLSNRNLVLLSSDKGFTEPDYMSSHWDQDWTCHGGTISFMVNYHAIQKYFEQQGGVCWTTAGQSSCLATMQGIMLQHQDTLDWTHSRYYFAEKVDQENPIPHLYHTQKLLYHAQPDEVELIFDGYLSFLRLANHDPTLFCDLGADLFLAVEDMTSAQQTKLKHSLAAVRDNFYMIRQGCNPLYWVGMMYWKLGMHEDCIATFQESIATFGPDDQSLYYMANCLEATGEWHQALENYRAALLYDSDCEVSKAGIARVVMQIAQESI
jgi:SAM-dependent MidA family methyltransferase